MKSIVKEINRKKYMLFRIMKEQDKRKDLSYKVDEELMLIKEIKELRNRLKEVRTSQKLNA